MVTRAAATKQAPPDKGNGHSGYVVPVIHTRLPEALVTVGFYGGLAAVVVAGAVDVPLALLVGAGVVIARHKRS